MNILISILQILLGLWNITGGAYMTTHSQELISPWATSTFPSFFWIIFGAVQVLFSIGLIASVAKKCKKWAPVSAIGLAIIALLGIPFYASYAGFPGVLWGIIPALLLAFVAYWRAA